MNLHKKPKQFSYGRADVGRIFPPILICPPIFESLGMIMDWEFLSNYCDHWDRKFIGILYLVFISFTGNLAWRWGSSEFIQDPYFWKVLNQCGKRELFPQQIPGVVRQFKLVSQWLSNLVVYQEVLCCQRQNSTLGAFIGLPYNIVAEGIQWPKTSLSILTSYFQFPQQI